jgi:hypothetical protein
MGIVLNDGVKQTSATYKRLDFADGTPYHTVFAHADSAPVQLFPAAVAQVVREALVNVVTGGTASRINGAFATQRGKLVIGGKTGTGDNRFDTFASNGSVVESRVVNRVATFVFFIGRHFYGVITAYVPGEAAGNYGFTSALPVQVLKAMAPILQPLVAAGESRSLGWKEDLADFEAETQIPAPAAKVEFIPKVVVPAPMHLDLKLKTARPQDANANVKPVLPRREPVPLKPSSKLPTFAPAAPVPPRRPPAMVAPAPAPAAPVAPGQQPPDRFDYENSAPGEGFHLID